MKLRDIPVEKRQRKNSGERELKTSPMRDPCTVFHFTSIPSLQSLKHT